MASVLGSQQTEPNGRHLSHGQLRQLQWIVPRPWAPEVQTALATLALAGARVRVTVAGVEHWIGFFDGARIVDEALRPAAYPLLSNRGLLPVGGCGRRGANLYFLDVASPHLAMWLAEEGGEPRSLGVGLAGLWAAAVPEARVQLRRRLPEKSPRRLAKTSAAPSRQSATAASCKRTLPLFA